MKPHFVKKHPADFLFSLALFFLFTGLGILLILTGARVYRHCASQLEGNYTIRTGLAYVTEKIRQSDEAGCIRLAQIGSIPALLLSREIKGEMYFTYIYEDDGYLKELFISADAQASPDMGTALLEISDFEIEPVEGGFFRCTVSDLYGRLATSLIHPQSLQEENP